MGFVFIARGIENHLAEIVRALMWQNIAFNQFLKDFLLFMSLKSLE